MWIPFAILQTEYLHIVISDRNSHNERAPHSPADLKPLVKAGYERDSPTERRELLNGFHGHKDFGKEEA